jgi:DNA-binding response OmpR family regulator
LIILSEGCDAYIRKPFQEQELFDVIEKHLGVQYLYADASRGEEAGASRPAQEQAAVQAIGALPDEVRERLRHATVVGDLEQIQAAIEATGDSGLEPTQADLLTSTLSSLATNFEHDQILAMIDKAEAARD